MEIDFGNLHHAYLVIGERELAESSLHAVFDSQGVTLVGSPDFFILKEPLFGIDEARALSISAARKAFTGRKVFFIAPEKLTHEAQNALLKTFEDPYPETHFFLVVREEELVLPTLRSRMQTVRLEAVASPDAEAKKFLSLPVVDRLVFAKKFVDQEKNLSVFLDQLLLLVRRSESSPAHLKKIYDVRRVSDDRGTSPRLILEHLALVL